MSTPRIPRRLLGRGSDGAQLLLATDFEKKHDVYICSHNERNAAIKMGTTIFAAPFVLIYALHTLKVISVITTG